MIERKYPLFNSKKTSIINLFIILFLCVFLPACGRKAPPQLRVLERPAKAENLRVIHDERGLTISWSYPEGTRSSIRGFVILRSDNGDFKKRGYIESNRDFYFLDRDFKTDKTYRYRVIAEGIKGIMSEASEIEATPARLQEPPENISFVIKNDSIELIWDNKKGCYNIYRAYEGDYLLLNKEPLCKGFITDNISIERPARYIIRSVIMTDIVNEGVASKDIIIRLEDYIPSPPSDLRIASGYGKVFLLWQEPPEIWIKGYRIYRRVEGEKEFKSIGETDVPAFTDSALQGLEDKRLSYMIKALGPIRESKPIYGECIYQAGPDLP